ncbi:MAG: hypothetical protein K2G38_06120, partial [Clostridia bacterium]|nr:hypothetical protein [Clostridia bacterium]
MNLKTKRNLLTVILAVLCAVLLAVGVSFVLPKNEVNTAYADPAPTYDTPKIVGIGARSNTGSTGIDYSSCGAGAGDMSATVTSTATEQSVSIKETALSNNNTTCFYEFYVKVDVPANTKYVVDYKFSLSITNSAITDYTTECMGNPGNPGGNCNGASVTLYSLYKSADGADGDAAGLKVWIDVPDNSGALGGSDAKYLCHVKSCDGTNKCGDSNGTDKTDTLTFNNTTSDKVTYSRKYIAYLGCYAAQPMQHANHQFESKIKLTVTNTKTTAAPTAAVTELTYTGSQLTFESTYNHDMVEAYKVEGTDFNGDTISSISMTDFDDTLGKFKPTLAGKYTVTYRLKPDEVTNGAKWSDNTTADKTLEFTVKRKAISVPAVLNSTQTYKAAEYEFGLNGDYDPALMCVKSDGYTSDNGSTITWDSTAGAEKFKATDAATYTVKFHLSSPNHIWNVDGTETAVDQSKTITIKKKEITITTTPAASPNLGWDFGAAGSIAITATANPITNPDFVLSIYYCKTSDTASQLTTGIDTTTKTLDVSQIESAGSYKLCIELTSAAANKNYSIADNKFEMPFEIKSNAIDLSALKVQYTKTSTGATQAEIPSSGLTYSYDSDTKTAEEYKFFLDFSALTYLTADSYTYRYDGTTSVVNGFTNAGTAKVEVKIKLADPSDVNHSLPATFATANTPFDSYTNNNDGTATLTFTVVIDKALTTLTGSDIPLQYWFAGDASKLDYDKDNPPECKDGIPVYVEWTGVKPHGVANVVFDSTPDTKVSAGDYQIEATVTLDDNYKTAFGGNTLRVQIPWKLSKQIIKLDWTDTQIDKPGLTPHFVKNLNNLTDGQKAVIKYVYYMDVSGSPDSVALTEAQFDALCTNDRYTDPKWLWVEAVIDTTVPGHEKFELENDPVKNPVRFKLGRNMTMVEVTKSPEWDKLVYGGTIDKPNAFTFTDKSTNLPWNSIFYELHVYKDGVDLGLFDTFDFTTADAAKDYAVQVVMKPAAINADGDEIYAIDIGKTIPFEIKPKAIALPTLGEMVFTGGDQSIKDYLGGETWATYGPAGKNVITLGGDFEGIRNVGVSDYVATLTLTDSNYCWDYGTGATGTAYAVSLKVGAGYSVDGTAQQANYKWNMAPLVIDTTNMWSKGKNGATLNLPQNVKDLISAGSLELGYKYYENGQFVENPEIKGNKQFKVEAVFGGDDAVRNVQFKTGDTTIGNTSPAINYTVPQSGMQAFGGKVLSFLKNYWWWILIALAILILLIILIVVIAKRRKNKEEREEKKRQKEEEKEREEEKRRREEEREEEKRRREEEREREKAEREAERERQKAELEAEKERQKAELELAKAKQEAELAKMKAEAAAT